MALGWLDQNGITIPTYSQIRDYLVEQYRNIYGQDVYLEPDSKDGQWISIIAESIFDCYLLAGDVYNSFSPVTAQGTGLDLNVALNGIVRKPDTYSTVDVQLTGRPSTVIRNGQVGDIFSQVWLLPEVVEIPDSGTILVAATAQLPGATQAPSGSITTILTPTRGWSAVTNIFAAFPGQPVETDYQLRQRQRVSVSSPARTIMDSIISNILLLPGVIICEGYENDTNITDDHGFPPHSICLVVYGGDPNEIALSIFRTKSPGVATFGNTSVEVEDRYGITNTINFQRPSIQQVWCNITITPKLGYVSSTATAISQAVANFVNGLSIGSTIFISRLYSVINACEPDINIVTFDVVDVQLSIDGITFSATNIVLNFDGLASSDENKVVVGVTT